MLKRRFVLRTLLMMISVAALTACGGAPSADEGTPPDESITQPQNPMAVSGQQHNEVLACLSSNPPQATEDRFAAMQRCGFEPAADFSIDDARSRFQAFGPDLPDWIDWLIASPFNPNPSMMGGGVTFDEAQAGFLEELGEIVALGQEDTPSSERVDEAVLALDALEGRAVDALGDAEDNQSKAVLAGIAIAKASLGYWSDIWLDEDAAEPFASGPKWWQVVAADVAGGIVGGIFGGGAGAVGLGTAASKVVGDLAEGANGDDAGGVNPGVGVDVVVGQDHNETLACLESNADARTMDPIAPLIDICPVDGLDADMADQLREAMRTELGLPDATHAGEFAAGLIDDWSSWFDTDRYSDAQKRYLEEVGTIIESIDERGGQEAFDRGLLRLRLLEGRARGELIAGDDASVLMGLNVAVHSYQYWADSDFVAPAAGRPKWWQVTLADVAGGVVGGIFGGGAGAVGLGAAASKVVGDLGNNEGGDGDP